MQKETTKVRKNQIKPPPRILEALSSALFYPSPPSSLLIGQEKLSERLEALGLPFVVSQHLSSPLHRT